MIAPSTLGSKNHPAGPSQVPLRRIHQAIYPPRMIRLRIVEGKASWRDLDMINLPRSPSMSSRNEVWKVKGVSTFSLGVLVRGHGIHTNIIYIPGTRYRVTLLQKIHHCNIYTRYQVSCHSFAKLNDHTTNPARGLHRHAPGRHLLVWSFGVGNFDGDAASPRTIVGSCHFFFCVTGWKHYS